MKKTLLIVFLLCAQGYAIFSSYTVVKGDTLWDLSRKNYDNPFLWPSLWEVNKSTVTNPDLIYPGQVLLIPPAEEIKKITPPTGVAMQGKKQSAPPQENNRIVAAPAEDIVAEKIEDEKPVETVAVTLEVDAREQEPLQEQPAPPRVEKTETKPVSIFRPAVQPTAASGSFAEAQIVKRNFKPAGVIVDFKDEKLLVSQGDIVYVDFAIKNVDADDQFVIYRKNRTIRHPVGGDEIGIEIIKIGSLKVIEKSKTKATAARVVSSNSPVEIMDWVLKIE